jgi:hypothetical protein
MCGRRRIRALCVCVCLCVKKYLRGRGVNCVKRLLTVMANWVLLGRAGDQGFDVRELRERGEL